MLLFWKTCLKVITVPPHYNKSFSSTIWAEWLLLEKVGGLPSLGKLQQIVCERREVLSTRGLGFVWRWCSRRSGGSVEGSLAGGDSVWGWRGVTRTQCFVGVFAGCPIYEPLQGRGEGRAQTFWCEAGTQKSSSLARSVFFFFSTNAPTGNNLTSVLNCEKI